MASTPIEVYYDPGKTLTVDIFPEDSDTASVTGRSLTEETNRKGFYKCNVTEALSGYYTLHISDAVEEVAYQDIYLEDNTSTHYGSVKGTNVIHRYISGLNNLSAAEVNTEVDTALADYDGPTKTEMDSAFTEIKGATWSGTDTLEAIKNTINLCTGYVLAQNDFDPANDVVANVTLVDTVTTNTDMRGTDSAFLAASAPANIGDLSITATTGKVTVGTNDDKTGYSISGTITTLDALDTAQDSQHSTTQGKIDTVITGTPAQKYNGVRGPGVYYDGGAANTSTTIGTDGTVDNPVSSWTAATTLCGSLGANRVYMKGSTTLDMTGETVTGFEIIGLNGPDHTTINLGTAASPSVLTRVAIYSAKVYGTHDLSDRLDLIDCELDDAPAAEVTTLYCFAHGCLIVGDITINTTSDNVLNNCSDGIAGSGYPTITAAGASGSLLLTNYQGDVGFDGLSASHDVGISGKGSITYESGCNVNAEIRIRGHFTETDNTAGMNNVVSGANITRSAINAEADTALADYDAPTAAEMTAAFTEIKGTTWSSATDTLEAIRDRGDAAWVTADVSALATSAALATVDANVDAILVDTGTTLPATLTTILADTNELQTNQGNWLTADVSSLATSAALATVDANVDSILVDTGTTIPAQISGLNNLSAAEVNSEVDTALSDYDGPTQAEMTAAFTEIKGSTWSSTTDTLEEIRDNLGGGGGGDATAANQTTIINAIAALNDISAADVIDYDMGNGRTVAEALAPLRNKWTIASNVYTVYDTDDTTVLWTAAQTETAGDPTSSMDPV